MSEPRVHQSAGGGACNTFESGHNTHWIPAIRKFVDSPRQSIRIQHIENNEFEVEFNGIKHRWYYHAPEVLASLIDRDPDNFTVVIGRKFVNYNFNGEGGIAWFNMSHEPIEKCPTDESDEELYAF